MTFASRAGFAFLATALIGCAANEPLPELYAIAPDQAYSNQDVRVFLSGAGLMPSFRVDPSTDQRVAIMDGFSGRIGKDPIWAPLTQFDWLGPEQISARLPGENAEDLVRTPSICPCDVEITDPRGRRAVLLDAFAELGPDKKAPTVTIASPMAGIRYCPGGTLPVRCTIDDLKPGFLTSVTWNLKGPSLDEDLQNGRCPFEVGASHVECAFDLTIDKDLAPDETLHLSVTAIDSGGNVGSTETQVVLSAPPMVKSLSPTLGPTTGGTDIIITGTWFESDSRAYFGDSLLYPGGGVVSEGNTTISGYTPAHPAGEVTVKVVSRLGEMLLPQSFEYKDWLTGGTP